MASPGNQHCANGIGPVSSHTRIIVTISLSCAVSEHLFPDILKGHVILTTPRKYTLIFVLLSRQFPWFSWGLELCLITCCNNVLSATH